MANPSLRRNSYQIEGVVPIKEMDYVPFQGGMDVVRKPYQLPLAAYSDIQNMRPLRPGFIKRKGQSKLHSTADGTNKVVTLYQFSKGMQDEVKTYAQMSSGDILQATNNPPAVTTGAFGSSVHTSDDYSTMTPASWATLRDKLFYADGTGYPLYYPGADTKIDSFIVYKSDAAIPDMPIAGADYTEEARDDDSTEYADVSSLSTLAAYDAIFIRTTSPADTFNIVMVSGKTNSSAAVFAAHYWNGAWSAVSSFVDGTSSSGKGLGQDGAMSFTMPTDHNPRYLFGEVGYWVRLSLSSGALSADTHINTVTYESSWQKIQNMWDGITREGLEAYVYDGATHKFYSATSISADAILSTDKIYFNSITPIIGVYISVGSTPNENATVATLKYSAGAIISDSSFTAVTSLEDSTSSGGISLARDGWMTFARPTDEQPGSFRSSTYYSYWYELSFSANLTEEMVLSIEVMPYYDIKDFGKCYAVQSFKRRMAYAFENIPGYIAISAAYLPTCLNGSDFVLQDIGDGRSNKVTCIKRFYNELLVWQEEKGKEGGCLTLVEGYSVKTFGKRIISTLHGTFSSKSAVVVEDVPTSGKLMAAKSGEIVQADSKITAAFFICRDGIFMTDGKGLDMISGPVQKHFDPKEPQYCIRRGYENEHWIDYDSMYQVIRVGLACGESAANVNTFLAYDILSKKWISYDNLGQPLACHIEVESSSGQFPLLQIGGGVEDGTVYLLNNTIKDVDEAIESYVAMEFDGGGHEIHIEEIVIRAAGDFQLLAYSEDVLKSTIDIMS